MEHCWSPSEISQTILNRLCKNTPLITKKTGGTEAGAFGIRLPWRLCQPNTKPPFWLGIWAVKLIKHYFMKCFQKGLSDLIYQLQEEFSTFLLPALCFMKFAWMIRHIFTYWICIIYPWNKGNYSAIYMISVRCVHEVVYPRLSHTIHKTYNTVTLILPRKGQK